MTASGEKLSIAIIGAGSVGLLLGGRLALAGHRVTVLAREGAAARLAGGVRLRRHDGKEETARPAIVTALDGSLDWDFVLCAVRAEQLADALAQLRRSGVRGRALVLCTPIWGPDPTYHLGGFGETMVLSPGLIAGDVDGALRYRMSRTAVGPLTGEVSARMRELVAILSAAGVPARVRRDVARSYVAQLAVGLPWALAIEDSGFDLAALAKDGPRRAATARASREAVRLARKRSGGVGLAARLAAAVSGPMVAIGGRLLASHTRRGWGKVAWNHLRKIAAQDRAMLDDLYRWGAAHGQPAPALGALVGAAPR